MGEEKKKKIEERRLIRCQDCACLVAGENGQWVCDECQDLCKNIADCPENM